MLVQIDSEELFKLKRECADAKDELRKIEETIYYNPNWGNPELQDRISRVEDVLGFKLYCWQKTYIANGKFRRYGETTAKILKELLDIEGEPIDYRRPAGSKVEEFYRCELIDIKEKLDAAGIKTRDVIFSGICNKRLNTKSVKNCNNRYFVKHLDQVLRNKFPNCSIDCWLDESNQLVYMVIEGFIDDTLRKLVTYRNYRFFREDFDWVIFELEKRWRGEIND